MSNNSIIQKIISYIARCQNANGSFSSDIVNAQGKIIGRSETTFVCSLILISLRECSHYQQAKIIIDKGLAFLISEQSNKATWNYWQRNHENNKDKHCPDDCDDTSLALTALSLYKPEYITPKLLARIVKNLIACEEKPGGPYHTWILPNTLSKAWHDLDPVVNANIAYFLKLQDISSPEIKKFLDKKTSSKYYTNPLVTLYFIYKAFPQSKAIATIFDLRTKDNVWGSDLNNALALTTLLRLDYERKKIKKECAVLMNSALNNSWQSEPLYIEENKDVPHYAGSAALTAALALEALSLYLKTEIQPRPSIAILENKKIVKTIRQRLAFLPPPTQQTLKTYLRILIENKHGHGIIYLPFAFASSLHIPITFSRKIAVSLSCANLYGWLAYAIYDDIMDDNADQCLLPLANTCLREVCRLYTRLIPKSAQNIFTNIMDAMEYANAWEYEHCQLKLRDGLVHAQTPPRFPKKYLANKSLPHALGPITILLLQGYAPVSLEIKAVQGFFEEYLAARQLNDDAHDWYEDLGKGRLNAANVPVLKHYFSLSPLPFSVHSIPKILVELFWKKELKNIALQIIDHTREARCHLSILSTILNIQYLEKLLIPAEQAAQQALHEQKQSQAFLKAFSK